MRERDFPRRGLDRIASARYIGVGVSKFDEMVKDGRMPPPKMIDRRKVWDIKALDVAFDELPDVEAASGEDTWADLERASA